MSTLSDDSVRSRLLAEADRLRQLRDELDAGLRSADEQEDISELSSADQHPADTGTETFNRERDLAILDGFDSELRELEAALARLEAGEYGICEACGEQIGDARLDAMPAARFCLKDQALAEDEALRAGGATSP
jgi:DnaK suppressor protein